MEDLTPYPDKISTIRPPEDHLVLLIKGLYEKGLAFEFPVALLVENMRVYWQLLTFVKSTSPFPLARPES